MKIDELINELKELRKNGAQEVFIYNNDSYTINEIIELSTTEDKQTIWLNTTK